MFYDLYYLVDKCITRLPERLNDFKSICEDNFNKVYDTKVLATSFNMMWVNVIFICIKIDSHVLYIIQISSLIYLNFMIYSAA